MATLTLNPTKDTWLAEAIPTLNLGTDAEMTQGLGTPNRGRLVLEFDLATLPSAAIVSAAVVRLNVTAHATVAGARTANIYRLRRSNWVEDQATWDDYKSGSPWTGGGANSSVSDHDTTVAADVWTYASATGYQTLTGFEALVDDARNTRSGIVRFVAIHSGAATESVTVNTKENGSNKPELVITYTVPASIGTTRMLLAGDE